jgi:hypothetical protein
MAQTQAVMALMEKNPDLFNRKVVIERFLKQIKVPSINELMKDVPSPEERPVADENVAMALGQMGFAFIDQDHLAHIQGHLDTSGQYPSDLQSRSQDTRLRRI